MAKRGTLRHKKNVLLARLIDRDLPGSFGVLCALWDWVAESCPTGDLSGVDGATIASVVGYRDDPDRLWTSLIAAGWVDDLGEGRYYIHDWHDHAEDGVHVFLCRRRLTFADGTYPKITRLNAQDRAAIAAWHPALGGSPCVSRAHEKRTGNAPPLPLPLASAMAPAPAAEARAGQPPGTPASDDIGSAQANSGVSDPEPPPLPGDAYRRAEELYGQSVDAIREYFRGEVGATARSNLLDAIEHHLLEGRQVTVEHIRQASERACASWNRKQFGGSPRIADPLVYELNALVNPPRREKRNGQSKISGAGRSDANSSSGGAAPDEAARKRRGSEAAERYFNRT